MTEVASHSKDSAGFAISPRAIVTPGCAESFSGWRTMPTTECPRCSASASSLPPMLPLAPIKAILAMAFDELPIGGNAILVRAALIVTRRSE